MRWTVVQVAEALGVSAPKGLDPLARLAGVSIDSRTVQPGELFLAIRGPRHDGHGFVAGALAGGAAGRGGGARAVVRIRAGNPGAALCRGRHARCAPPAGLTSVRDLAEGAARTAHRRRGRFDRQDHHERNFGGARGLAVPRIEDARESEQRIRAAADAAAAR